MVPLTSRRPCKTPDFSETTVLEIGIPKPLFGKDEALGTRKTSPRQRSCFQSSVDTKGLKTWSPHPDRGEGNLIQTHWRHNECECDFVGKEPHDVTSRTRLCSGQWFSATELFVIPKSVSSSTKVALCPAPLCWRSFLSAADFFNTTQFTGPTHLSSTDAKSYP